MIGSALVGTFLGFLLAYGIVNPFANRCKQVIEEDGAIYHVVKQIIVASLHGHPQPLVIEAARSSLSHANQPAFAEVFAGMRGKYVMAASTKRGATEPEPRPIIEIGRASCRERVCPYV